MPDFLKVAIEKTLQNYDNRTGEFARVGGWRLKGLLQDGWFPFIGCSIAQLHELLFNYRVECALSPLGSMNLSNELLRVKDGIKEWQIFTGYRYISKPGPSTDNSLQKSALRHIEKEIAPLVGKSELISDKQYNSLYFECECDTLRRLSGKVEISKLYSGRVRYEYTGSENSEKGQKFFLSDGIVTGKDSLLRLGMRSDDGGFWVNESHDDRDILGAHIVAILTSLTNV